MSDLTKKAKRKIRKKYNIDEDVKLSTHIMHNWDDNCGCDGGYVYYGSGCSMACKCHSTYLVLVTDGINFIKHNGKQIVVDFKHTKTYKSRMKIENKARASSDNKLRKKY